MVDNTFPLLFFFLSIIGIIGVISIQVFILHKQFKWAWIWFIGQLVGVGSAIIVFFILGSLGEYIFVICVPVTFGFTYAAISGFFLKKIIESPRIE